MHGRDGRAARAQGLVVDLTTYCCESTHAAACGQPQPHTSNLNFTAGQTIPNLVIAGVGTSGKIGLASLSPTHVVADLAGWYPGP